MIVTYNKFGMSCSNLDYQSNDLLLYIKEGRFEDF